MKTAGEILKDMPSIKQGLDDFYGQQTVLNALNLALKQGQTLPIDSVISCYALFNEEDNIQKLYQSEVNAREALRERQHIVPLTEYYIDLIQID